MKTASVTYRGVPMECTYDYTPEEPRTREEPGIPEDVQLDACLVGGVDIFDILTPEQVVAVEWKILEARSNQAEEDACARADMRRDEREFAA